MLARVARWVGRTGPETPTSFADRIEAQVRKRPERPALIQGDRILRYDELDRAANRFARWAHDRGVRRGDVVALLLGNRPETPIAWYGLAKIGAVSALLNHHLRGQALAHCIAISEAKRLVVHAEQAEAWESVLPLLPKGIPARAIGGTLPDAESIDADVDACAAEALPKALREDVRAGDPFLYIYTSGTTGLPKAARISHRRALMMSAGAVVGLDLGPEDRNYIALPLYHSAGGVMALGGALLAGATAVIAPRFSARSFWSDCVRHRVTTFQYIGELCRYLLHSPPHEDERHHRVRACLGNGLRPEIWEPFQQRFGIPRIVEFYGATEGNVALMNYEGKVGAVGRIPPFLRRILGIELVRYDVEKGEPVRDARGFCIRCAPGEAGEAIGRITRLNRFEGYTHREATEKKILRHAFKEGDAYFRTGDLLRMDEEGWFTFVDRVGDTFRWKGENVATSEVTEVLDVAPGVREATVYGVEVPGHEGRAGMAALVVDEGFDPESLFGHLERNLPAYSRPLFLRLRKELLTTATFKHRKVELVKEGFDPARVSDPLLFRDDARKRYVPLTAELHQRILAGEVRL